MGERERRWGREEEGWEESIVRLVGIVGEMISTYSAIF